MNGQNGKNVLYRVVEQSKAEVVIVIIRIQNLGVINATKMEAHRENIRDAMKILVLVR